LDKSDFEPSRRLPGALVAHSDPARPLSPFSHETAEIRENDIDLFRRAISESRLRVPEDLNAILPRLIWMYQIGIILCPGSTTDLRTKLKPVH
jgi:hypothetical protein